jgi:hypothetical protein
MCLVASAVLLCCADAAFAGTLYLNVCGTFTPGAGPLTSWAERPLGAAAGCGSNGPGLGLAVGSETARQGASAGWVTTAPAGITIQGIHVTGGQSLSIGDGYGWWGEFFWDGGPGPAGRSSQITDTFGHYGCCAATNLDSQRIGWFMSCATSSCHTAADLDVGGLQLTAIETRAPSIYALGGNNLWFKPGWIRGTWPASFAVSDPSGVCRTSATLGNITLKPNPDQTQYYGSWTQCSQTNVPVSFDTRASQGSLGLGVGTMPLLLTATNAAGVSTGSVYAKTITVDNTTPTVSLSGPTDVPSTAGTQYVTATGSAGPSGLWGFSCSVDGGPLQSYPGASAHVPVSGAGTHAVTCSAQDNAVDPNGVRGSSTPATWTVKIGAPSVLQMGFLKLVGLHCHRSLARVRVVGRWTTVRRRGKPIRVRGRSRTRLERVTRCHVRMVRRRTVTYVPIRLHGRLATVKRVQIVRVPVLPHTVNSTTLRVPFGLGTDITGWLGTPRGIALPDRTVQILAAPDDGLGRFSVIGTTTTSAIGGWAAHIPRGPSRLIEAVYDGDATTESSTSPTVKLTVPAKIKLLSVSPKGVPWGGTVRIVGQLVGGYLPPGGALVRLRIGTGRSYYTYGVEEHVAGDGRFTTSYTFGLGQPSVVRSYYFQIATLPMGDYPYAPASSGRRTIVVGGRSATGCCPHG